MLLEVLSALFSLGVGLTLYVLSSRWNRRIAEPRVKYRELRANVKSTIYYNNDRISNPLYYDKHNKTPDISIVEGYELASKNIRSLAAEIIKFNEVIDDENSYRKKLNVPNYIELENAASCIIGISNSLFVNSGGEVYRKEHIKECIDEINKVFKLNIH